MGIGQGGWGCWSPAVVKVSVGDVAGAELPESLPPPPPPPAAGAVPRLLPVACECQMQALRKQVVGQSLGAVHARLR